MDFLMTELFSCPACAAPAVEAHELRVVDCRPAAGTGPVLLIRLVQCGCGHAFVNPQPTWEELSPFYQSDYHVFADVLPDAARVDRLIAERHRGDRLNHARLVAGGRYLDVGCGLGEMVAGMARLGMNAEGVEPSRVAVDRAQGLGLKVFHGMLQDACYPDAAFDSVSMYHVLEHTPDPVTVLAECRRILKPGGELLVGVPNFESRVRGLVGWCWTALDLPRHLQHFTPDSLERAARRAGLAVTAVETESLPAHVELELATWLRRRLLVPKRLTLATRVTWPVATFLSRQGNATGRGEAIVAHLVPIQGTP
jgi:SAM-dependent methyltransferase